MKNTLAFARIFFCALCILFMTTYATAVTPEHELNLQTALLGLVLGSTFFLFLLGFEVVFRRYSLRAFNLTMVGMLFGYIMGKALYLVFDEVLDLSGFQPDPGTGRFLAVSIFLFAIYIGIVMTIRAADEFTVSLPFLRLTPTTERRSDIIVDGSLLEDARVLDLAGSGLLDGQLVIPRFVVRNIQTQLDAPEDAPKGRARRAMDTVKKLQDLPSLNLRFDDTDLNDCGDPSERVLKLARMNGANVLTAEMNRVQTSEIQGIRVINIHSLSNALKPLTQSGELLTVKIQRYGKESRQGVGYLEDGTMVVVNGGGDFIGQDVQGQVLSVKHTSSGRMIFCNAYNPDLPSPPVRPAAALLADAQR